MNILFMGGKQAGCIGLLTLKALGHNVSIYSCDYMIDQLATVLKLPRSKPDEGTWDMLVSVHGRRIISPETLEGFKYGGINLHPCLSQYPGADPIGRLLRDCEHTEPIRLSIGAHVMTEQVDSGKVLIEEFEWLSVHPQTTRNEVYNMLYPLYSEVLVKAIEKRVAI